MMSQTHENCYGTYMAKNMPENYPRVTIFFADCNPNTLIKSLDIIRDETIWEVSDEDSQKIDQNIRKMILRKFGFKGIKITNHNGLDILMPMPVGEWNNLIVEMFPEEVKIAIRGNNNLLSYLVDLVYYYNPEPLFPWEFVSENNKENVPPPPARYT